MNTVGIDFHINYGKIYSSFFPRPTSNRYSPSRTLASPPLPLRNLNPLVQPTHPSHQPQKRKNPLHLHPHQIHTQHLIKNIPQTLREHEVSSFGAYKEEKEGDEHEWSPANEILGIQPWEGEIIVEGSGRGEEEAGFGGGEEKEVDVFAEVEIAAQREEGREEGKGA